MNLYDNPDFFAAYSQMARSQDGLQAAGEWHQLKNLLPPMDGKAVLDLGCGYGWHCRYAAEQGASSVLGIDSSEKMLQKAREINAHPRIVYHQCDLTQFAYPVNQYDVVMSNLVLHYVENLPEIYANVHRTLRRSGCFVLNIEHPTFTAGVNQEWVNDADGQPLYWPVDDYFYPGARETNFLGHTVRKYHHTLTQILGGLLAAGFTLTAIEEAMPSEEMIPLMPEEMKRPMMLLVRAEK